MTVLVVDKTAEEESILLDREGPVEWLTLNRPFRLNALDSAMCAALTRYFADLADRPDIRVVIMRGAGRGFCAGLDLSEKDEGAGRLLDGPEEFLKVQVDVRNVIVAMRKCSQPIIALVHGAATGGGMALALASDVRIAADTARMNAAFVQVGLSGCDVGVSYLLPRLVGGSVASELLLTGKYVDSDRALKIGLVSDVVAEDELHQAGVEMAASMLAAAPLGLRMTKEVLEHNMGPIGFDAAIAMEDRTQTICGQTEDFREGLSAFREKRSPRFIGK